jgi:hypothetical protein
MQRSHLALLMFLLAAPAFAGNRLGDGFHGGGGFHGGRGFHSGFFAFRHSGIRAYGFFGGYGCGYNCGFGFDSEGYDYGNGYGKGYGDAPLDSAAYAVRISNGLSSSYVPDPVGADIPPMIVRTNCWVRRAAYDPSGVYFGQTLVDLCRHSDRVSMTGLKARAKAFDTGPGVPQSPPIDRKTR